MAAYANSKIKFPVKNVQKEADGDWALDTTYASSGESVVLTGEQINATDYEIGQLLFVPAEANLDGSNAAPACSGFTLTSAATPSAGEFSVDYSNGLVIFPNGTSTPQTITYSGKGTVVGADEINALDNHFAGTSKPETAHAHLSNVEGRVWCDTTNDPAQLKFAKDASANYYTLASLDANQTFTGNQTISGTLTVSGVSTFSNANGVTTNVITERTATSGVTIDSLLVKDAKLDFTANSKGTFQGIESIVYRMVNNESAGNQDPLGVGGS